MNEKYLYGIIGLLAGIVITWLFASNAVNSNNMGMMRMMNMRPMTVDKPMLNEHHGELQDAINNTMGHTMEGMMSGLNNKTGDEFDKAFIAEMIIHHQGAIDMANAALKDAKHQELKDMANAIISAQSKEIEHMKRWQEAWYNQ